MNCMLWFIKDFLGKVSHLIPLCKLINGFEFRLHKIMYRLTIIIIISNRSFLKLGQHLGLIWIGFFIRLGLWFYNLLKDLNLYQKVVPRNLAFWLLRNCMVLNIFQRFIKIGFCILETQSKRPFFHQSRLITHNNPPQRNLNQLIQHWSQL